MNTMMEELSREQDHQFLDQLGIKDPGLSMVQEFHEVFNCHISPRPAMPVLTEADAAHVRAWGTVLADHARALKEDAAIMNGRGHAALGLILIRLQLHLEECCAEFADACADGDLVKVLDSLADSRYVVNGTFLTFGLHEGAYAADCEVHSSNMSKLGADGKPVISQAGRVIKGPRYRRADFAPIVEALLEE